MPLGGFAAVSLLLSAIGINGVISYSVTPRTRAIGIRTALGASRGDGLRLVLRHGMGLSILGRCSAAAPLRSTTCSHPSSSAWAAATRSPSSSSPCSSPPSPCWPA